MTLGDPHRILHVLILYKKTLTELSLWPKVPKEGHTIHYYRLDGVLLYMGSGDKSPFAMLGSVGV